MSRLPDSVFEALSPLGQSLVRIEERVARFVPGDGTGKRECISCVRKRYGGPSCCDEGWDRYRARRRGGDPGGCANYLTESRKAFALAIADRPADVKALAFRMADGKETWGLACDLVKKTLKE